MGTVHKPFDSECYTTSTEPFRIDLFSYSSKTIRVMEFEFPSLERVAPDIWSLPDKVQEEKK
jgi:hypothetical protein